MYIFHILIVISIKTVLIACSANAIKIKCTNIDDFYYAVPGTQCSSFYRCNGKGQYDLKQCTHGTYFDYHKQICTRSADVCNEPQCSVRSKGLHADVFHSCLRFFTCHAGHVTSVDNCPAKHLHDGQKCAPEEHVPCDSTTDDVISYAFSGDDRCSHKPNGKYAIVGNCNEFLICVNGKVSEIKNCPSDQFFHDERKLCLPKHSVPHCYSDTFKYTVTSDLECRHKPNGLVADQTSDDCTSYLVCRDGHVDDRKQCNNQAVFNGESCVPSLLHQCSQKFELESLHEPDLCHRKLNGLYPSPQYGCNSFMRCVGERVLEIKQCPNGQFFGPESRKCTYASHEEQRRCHERGISLDCDGKADGFYQQVDCESYYYCYKGYKTEYRCTRGKIYNGDSCVPQHQYNCPKDANANFCAFRLEGYYKDPNDGCRTYSYCLRGHKITYLCEPNHVFDVSTKKCVIQERAGHLDCHADEQCHGKSEGYHADLRSNCRNYVFCKNNEKITQLTCRNNNVFNGQKCVPPSSYTCPSLYNHHQLNCVTKRRCMHQCEKDGFYPNLNADCREYYFCIGGKLSKLACAHGKRFNGEICVPEDQFNCPVFCDSENAYTSCPLGGYIP